MALQYKIEIEIRFNEHDNEKVFKELLEDKLKEICAEVEMHMGHKDVFVEIKAWGGFPKKEIE